MATEASQHFCSGNEAFVDEDFDFAIKCYTEAIKLDGDKSDYYLKRCNAYIKKDYFTDAIKDAESSININPKDYRPHQRKGFALFSLKNYKDALTSFQCALDLDRDNEKTKQWLRKCEAEIDLAERSGCTRNKPAIGLSKIHTVEDKSQSKNIEANSQVITTTTTTTTNAAENVPIKSKVKYDWYQTETHVVITVLVKKLKREDVNVEFTDSTLSLSAKLPSGSDYSLELDLAHEIISNQSASKVLSTKIEVKMKKKEGIRWSSLEIDNESQFANAKAINATNDTTHKYPTSRHLNTDWDKLAKEVQEEETKEESEGDAALNKLFKQIYSDGSDEVKRAMNKSFQESGGTVLSTNWSEIKKDKVEIKPPDCMEYKKYEY